MSPPAPCPVILDDDEFRKALIKSLNRKHFTVTFSGSQASPPAAARRR